MRPAARALGAQVIRGQSTRQQPSSGRLIPGAPGEDVERNSGPERLGRRRQGRFLGDLGPEGVPFCVSWRLSYHHAVWHLFVLAGSALHYAEVLRCVAPA